MSTLALSAVGAAAPAADSKPRVSFLTRLLEAHQRQVLRLVQQYLAAQSDSWLRDLGLGPADIESLRTSAR